MNTATILIGDVRERLAELPDQSVQCVVTSPPYWGLRDYGNDGQIGLEQTPDEYVDEMVKVFAEVKRVLKDDGVLWLNLGDSYAGNNSRASNNGRAGFGSKREGVFSKMGDGLKTKDLVGIPWRVAFALQADGWWLRQDIIWHLENQKCVGGPTQYWVGVCFFVAGFDLATDLDTNLHIHCRWLPCDSQSTCQWYLCVCHRNYNELEFRSYQDV